MIVEHVKAAIATMPPPLRQGAYAKLLATFVRPLEQIETAVDDIGRAYGLTTSSTPLFMLQMLARRVGLVLPPGFSKAAYRQFIVAQGVALLSSGTWPQMYKVANLLRPPDVPPESLAWVDRVPPDGIQIGIPGIPESWAPVAKQILRQAKRAQDSLDLLQLPADFFTFDVGPGFDIGKLAKLL